MSNSKNGSNLEVLWRLEKLNQNEILLAYLEFWEDTELYMSSGKVINFGLPKSGGFVSYGASRSILLKILGF